MAKRLTDTDMWDKLWFFSLPDNYRLLWFFIKDRCNAVGIWPVNFSLVDAYIKKIDPVKAREYFRGRFIELEGGKYWLLIGFIEFQYGDLTEPSKTGKPKPMLSTVNKLLGERGLNLDMIMNITVAGTVPDTVPDTVGCTPQEKEKEKEIRKKKGGVGENGKKQQPPICENDLTEELRTNRNDVYICAKLLLESCPDVMSMTYPISLPQLTSLVDKFGATAVKDKIKSMENKGIAYLNKHGKYTYLTIESWLKMDQKRGMI